MEKVSVVIVNWNAGATLRACLTALSVRGGGEPPQVIVVWEHAGLLDERFFLFWADGDWCLRFRRAGWGVYYVPTASGAHFVEISRAGRRLGSAVSQG